MADTKISGLPPSTTPLAGTEVVPVVQSGTTKNVSVNNLTAGKAVPGSSFVANSRTVWGVAAAYDPPGPTGNDVGFAFGGGPSVIPIDGSGNATNGIASLGLPSYKWGTIYTGDNVVIGTAGKGIDFSADSHAAGMTSELLDDYEEGTWTPVPVGDSGSAGSLAYTSVGRYTKVGRLVTISGLVTLTNKGSYTGRFGIDGVPFSANVTQARGGAFIQNVTPGFTVYTSTPQIGSISYTRVYFDYSILASGGTQMNCSELANNSAFSFTISYMTS